MSVELDAVYRSHRLRLASTVSAGAAAAWARTFREREEAIETIVPLVEHGQAQTAALVAGYMTAKMTARGERVTTRALDPRRYTISALRGVPAGEVYQRPFGALAGQLEQGLPFPSAFRSSSAALERLVRTDLQLAQTHAARDWMGEEERIVGYRRVLGGGNSCALCIAASTRTYFKEELMPIHERCSCSVEPLFGTRPVPSVGTEVRVVEDAELGRRLLAEDWQP